LIQVLVITHGGIASELIAAARRILGELPGTHALALGWEDDTDSATAEIRAIVDGLGGQELLILTDMFGGTPTNLALAFLEPARVEVLTGVNLPMLLKVSSRGSDESLAEVSRKARSEGRRSIYMASEVLSRSQPTS